MSRVQCPECSTPMRATQSKCGGCGWKVDPSERAVPKQAADPGNGKCSWTDGHNRCQFPGTVSADTSGEGKRWFCSLHWRHLGDGRMGALILEESQIPQPLPPKRWSDEIVDEMASAPEMRRQPGESRSEYRERLRLAGRKAMAQWLSEQRART